MSTRATDTSLMERQEATATPERSIVRGGLLLMAAKLTHIAAGFGLYAFLLVILVDSLGAVEGTAAFGVKKKCSGVRR